MIITQKYHSAKDIDPEFIPTLEELLSDCIPSFEWLREHELTAPENIYFNYYIFFGDKTNAPIGFAQVAIEKDQKMKKPSFSFFNKKSSEKNKKAHWFVPGSFKEAIVFEPRYKSLGISKASHLFEEFHKRDDIEKQTLRFGQAYANMPLSFHENLINQQEKIIPDTLVKNQSSYQKYLESLPSDINSEVLNNWKQLHKRSLHLDEYEDFKEVFAYKNEGAKLYKEFKQDAKIKKYIKLNTTYLTLEHNKNLIGLVFLIKGYGHHYFYDFIAFDKSLDENMIHQLAIMHFYEKEDSDRLHLLFEPTDHHYFTRVGFTFRKQIELTYHHV